jgi:hypothetical protein
MLPADQHRLQQMESIAVQHRRVSLLMHVKDGIFRCT